MPGISSIHIMFNTYMKKTPITRTKSSTTFNHKSKILQTLSSSRKIDWVTQNIATKMADILLNGMDQQELGHQFREYTPYANIYTRKYIPEKERVLLNSIIYYNGHYLKEPYNNQAPNINNLAWIRPRKQNKDIGGHMLYNYHNAKQNIVESINNHPIDQSPINSERIFNPKWRNPNSFKFMTKKGFNTKIKSFSATETAWNKIENDGFKEKFDGGYHITGNLTRKRTKSKEVSKDDFKPIMPSDKIFYQRKMTSNSLRTLTAQKATTETNKPIYTSINIRELMEDSEIGVSAKETPILLKKSSSMCHSPSQETDKKLYKKTLENYYFENNCSPNKEIVQMKMRHDKQLTLSLIHI